CTVEVVPTSTAGWRSNTLPVLQAETPATAVRAATAARNRTGRREREAPGFALRDFPAIVTNSVPVERRAYLPRVKERSARAFIPVAGFGHCHWQKVEPLRR